MTIHTGHPFAEGSAPDDVRRFRGRQGGVVSLWTSGSGPSRSGLTVSSIMVARGETGRVLGLLDPLSDLAEEFDRTGRGVVQLLQWQHRDLSEAFAGLTPAPGGPFRLGDFEQTSHGPHFVDAGSWVLVERESVVEVGWSMLYTCRIVEVNIESDADPLVHRRGQYHRTSGTQEPQEQ